MLKINSRLTLALGLTMWILISKEGFVFSATSYISNGCFQTSGANIVDIFNETLSSIQCGAVSLPPNFNPQMRAGICLYQDDGSTMTVQLCLDLCTANSARNFTYAGLAT